MRIIRKIARVCIAATSLLGLLVLFVSFIPIDKWLAAGLAGSFEHRDGEVLIILTGAQMRQDVLGWDSYVRALYARDAFRKGHFGKILILGGSRDGTAISVLMKDFLVAEGISRNDIVTEDHSLSTRESAVNAKTLLSATCNRCVLLTSDYHMLRAKKTFAKVGLLVTTQAVPDVYKRGGEVTQRWPAFCDLIVEGGKIFYYFVRGWI